MHRTKKGNSLRRNRSFWGRRCDAAGQPGASPSDVMLPLASQSGVAAPSRFWEMDSRREIGSGVKIVTVPVVPRSMRERR